MKKTILMILIAVAVTMTAGADVNVGAGYFGHVLTHPGVVIEAEFEQSGSDGISVFSRVSAGAYSQPRYQTGLLLDAGVGMRHVFRSGIFVEESIGVGFLASRVNSEGVYSVTEDGTVSEASPLNPIDLTASACLGIGYSFEMKHAQPMLIWLRPGIFWQFPHRLSSTFTPVLQVGITYTVAASSK